MPGQEAVRATNGPMSSSLGAIELWAKSVVGNEPWTRDPNMLPIPWRDVSLDRKLCFGGHSLDNPAFEGLTVHCFQVF